MRAMTTSEWLRETREQAGISAEEATFRLRGVLPQALWVSSDTLRRTEKSDHPNPVLALGIARVCGRPITEAPEELQRQIAALRDLLASADGGGGLPIAQSRCNERAWDEPRVLRAVPGLMAVA